jgi:hypothetical protein
MKDVDRYLVLEDGINILNSLKKEGKLQMKRGILGLSIAVFTVCLLFIGATFTVAQGPVQPQEACRRISDDLHRLPPRVFGWKKRLEAGRSGEKVC